MFGRERETVDDAYAGDVIGIVGKDDFSIGDTLTEDPAIRYEEIPRFAPEIFAYLHNNSMSKYKRFRDGVKQLLQEGVVQSFTLENAPQSAPLLAAVGALQFEVVQYRLESEYGAECSFENLSYIAARWFAPKDGSNTKPVLPTSVTLARDSDDQLVALFQDQWSLRSFAERNPDFEISDIPLKSPTAVVAK